MCTSLRRQLRPIVAVVCLVALFGLQATAQTSTKGAEQPKIFKNQLNLAALPGPALPTTITMEIEDTVGYVSDVPYADLMTGFATTYSFPRLTNNVTAMGDIRRINGRAVKGLYVNTAFPVFATPDPSPENGYSIGDATRIAAVAQSFDLQTADGKPFGTIFVYGLAFGTPLPGAPENAGGGTVAIIGGTGAYMGIKGQICTTPDISPLPGPNASVRFASAIESPALRRVNGGGLTKFAMQIYPMFSADAVLLWTGEHAVFHSSDNSLVTKSHPAAAGETLVALVRNMGPTSPGVASGLPFPASPVADVNAPVDVQVNGQAAEVKFARGEPGAVNVYEVQFVVPAVSPGTATVQVFAGFIGGAPFPITVQ